MPAVKFFVRLDLDQIYLFLDEHQLDSGLRRNGENGMFFSPGRPVASVSATA
jgi:hypothetical protein